VALVVLLRGVNVGGHRTFRPSALARQLSHLGAINIGAAGTFVIPQPVTPTALRTELVRRLPFETEIVICRGQDLLGLMSRDVFAGRQPRPGIVRFVIVLSRLPRRAPRLPMAFPSHGEWLVKVVARRGRFVVGEYRRHMKTIGYLGKLDGLFGVPATTRNWNTITAIVNVLEVREVPVARGAV
jgi:uncharacterized protein (DUF1697 family)